MIDKELVRRTLNKLLELPIDSKMPHGSGVCMELGVASIEQCPEKMKGLGAIQLLDMIQETPEYKWCHNKCFNLTGRDTIHYIGIMSSKRKGFIMYLLQELDND